jgi:hypothetical protein
MPEKKTVVGPCIGDKWSAKLFLSREAAPAAKIWLAETLEKKNYQMFDRAKFLGTVEIYLRSEDDAMMMKLQFGGLIIAGDLKSYLE